MTHTTGAAPAIRQLYPQLDAGHWEPIAYTQGPTLTTTGPDVNNTPSAAHRCGNIPAQGKAKLLELAPNAMPKMIRRPRRLGVGLGR